ncbi:MAG TPA: NAD(P)-binding domain-containing protein [Pseudosphingobacterium sp.]|nr:NAD(P)-binding domain-containing protein [Pseudosphingobacterium sp.]
MNTQTLSMKSISIIGLGPMGQAMAQAYLEKGYNLTLWNRTASKAAKLREAGASLAQDLGEALTASKLVIISLTDYDIMFNLLENYTTFFKGRTLVNLSSDTPEMARKAAEWAASHGASFLTGGVMVPPPMVATAESYVFYSGNLAVLEQYRTILEVIGRTDYKGEDPGLALLFYQAMLDIMFTTVTGVMHATALVGTVNVSAQSFEPYVLDFFNFMKVLMQGMGAEVDHKKYNGELNNMNMMAAGMRHVAHASHDAGVNTTVPNLIAKIYEETVAKGHGKHGINSIIEVLKESSK